MPEYWQFMNRLRQDLGKGYTVAEEHSADAWQVNVRTGEVLYTPGSCVATYPCKVEDGAVLVDV